MKNLNVKLEWKWKWLDEKWYNKKDWECLIEVNPKYFRPSEVDFLLWDATKAREKLWWKPNYTVREMCKEMVRMDIEKFKKDELLKKHGYDILNQYE